MHSIAGGCGSSPAPLSRYISASPSWNALSNNSRRWRRRNANSARTRVRRFIIICSCFVRSTLGNHRSIRHLLVGRDHGRIELSIELLQHACM